MGIMMSELTNAEIIKETQCSECGNSLLDNKCARNTKYGFCDMCANMPMQGFSQTEIIAMIDVMMNELYRDAHTLTCRNIDDKISARASYDTLEIVRYRILAGKQGE